MRRCKIEGFMGGSTCKIVKEGWMLRDSLICNVNSFGSLCICNSQLNITNMCMLYYRGSINIPDISYKFNNYHMLNKITDISDKAVHCTDQQTQNYPKDTHKENITLHTCTKNPYTPLYIFTQ